MKEVAAKHPASLIGRFVLAPLAAYLLGFVLLTWPLILRFNTHYFCDLGDGLQNVWNLWWVNVAVTEFHQSPWRTSLLHHPLGISLLGHTLNPFNGFLGIGLMKFFSLTQTHNFIVVFSFVAGGWTAFLLGWHYSRSIAAAFIGGCIFTFSSYHFAHANGHLQLVSLEWMPLFTLLWVKFLERPAWMLGLGAALALFAVMLCDYYYFLYCVMIGLGLTFDHAIKRRDISYWLRKPYRFPFLVFIFAALATCGVPAAKLLWAHHLQPFWGAHAAWAFSTDLLAPFIPGGHWRFNALTEPFWSRIRGNIHENSVYLGWSVVAILIWLWMNRKAAGDRGLNAWFALMLIFGALAIGPRLTVWGWELKNVPMPYSVATRVFPPLQLSGMPLRMMIGVQLCAAVLFAVGWRALYVRSVGARRLAVGILPLLILEYLPAPMPSIRLETPRYVTWLADLPRTDETGRPIAILDASTEAAIALYYQTIHGKPMALGYVARYPADVWARAQAIYKTLNEEAWADLRPRFGVRYLVTPAWRDLGPDFELVFSEDEIAKVWDLGV